MFAADVAISGETIAAILPPGTISPEQASDVLDVRGQTILYGVPSCVPSLTGFETAAPSSRPRTSPRCSTGPASSGRGEVMDYRAVVRGDDRMRAIIDAILQQPDHGDSVLALV